MWLTPAASSPVPGPVNSEAGHASNALASALADAVFGFGRAFPGVRLTQAEGNHEELLEKLRSGELDIALTYDLVTSPDIDFQALAHLPPYVMASTSTAGAPSPRFSPSHNFNKPATRPRSPLTLAKSATAVRSTAQAQPPRV